MTAAVNEPHQGETDANLAGSALPWRGNGGSNGNNRHPNASGTIRGNSIPGGGIAVKPVHGRLKEV